MKPRIQLPRSSAGRRCTLSSWTGPNPVVTTSRSAGNHAPVPAGGAVQTYQYIHLQGTVYRIPAIALHIVAVLSNTAPIGVTRGPGFAETVNILERLIDAAAIKAGFDRA